MQMRPILTELDTTDYLITLNKNSATLTVSRLILSHQWSKSLNKLTFNSLHLLTGLQLVMLVQLRIKVNADHAGHSLPQLQLNHQLPLLTTLHPNNTQNNNLYHAPQLTKTPVAMVVGTTGPGTTKLTTHKNFKLHIPTPLVLTVLMEHVTITHHSVSQNLTQQLHMLRLVKQTRKLWLQSVLNQYQLQSKQTSLFSNFIPQVWLHHQNAVLTLITLLLQLVTELTQPMVLTSSLETHGEPHGVNQVTYKLVWAPPVQPQVSAVSMDMFIIQSQLDHEIKVYHL